VEEANKEQAPAPAAEGVPRKIIYIAKVDLLVGDFDKATEDLIALAREHKGYIANSNTSGSVGSPRNGAWTVRVPVEHFDAFLAAAKKLGELQSSKTDSEDITDKYYDLKAHIKTNKVEEEGLQKLLEKTPANKLEDVFAFRRELRAIRAEIEQQEGRMQRWDKETALATVTVTMNDRLGYVPESAPGFGTTVGRTFGGSIDVMLSVGKGLVLLVVALAPWLALFAIPGVPAFMWVRRKLRRPNPPPPPANPPPKPGPDAPTLSPV